MWGDASGEGAKLVVASFARNSKEKTMFLILTVVLIVALFGSLPTWPHSRDWGYYPSGGLSLLLLILVILFFMGRL